MKKLAFVIIALSCLFMVSLAYSMPFEPPVVTITGYPVEHWAGGEVNVSFDLAGRDCDVYLVIYTKDKGPDIPYQTNGAVVNKEMALGIDYHTFAGVDTCIVATTGEAFSVGTGRTIVWNGKDKLGNEVPVGDYVYYLLANDAVNPPVPFGNNFGGWYGTPRPDQYTDLDTLAVHGYKKGGFTNNAGTQIHNVQLYRSGVKLDKPRVLWGFSYYELGQDTESGLWWAYQVPEGTSPYSNTQIDTDDGDIIWFTDWDGDAESCFIGKALLNTDGPAETVTDFGDQGKFWYYGSSRSQQSGGCETAGVVVAGSYNPEESYSVIYVADKISGEEITQIDAYDWFVASSEDVDKGSRASEGPGMMTVASHDPNRIFNVQWCSCAKICFNPLGGENWFYWANMNGDYYGDKAYPGCSGFIEDSAWICYDCRMGMESSAVNTDTYNFAHYLNDSAGEANIFVLGPDGYGICYMARLNQITGYNKWWSFIVDNNTAYDGTYAVLTTGAPDDPNAAYGLPVWNGYDICKNIITIGVGVESGTPTAYYMFNAPDPFNPSTTITYGMAKAGHVTVDVYNIMGQKVATLYDGHRDTGTYSVRWDASGFSNGVYFAVMKAEGFTKSEKMMLVK